PPVLENFTNYGNAWGISASYERELSEKDRIRLTLTRDEVRFEAPNNLFQQAAGQRQDLTNTESGVQVYYQHVISPDLLFSAAGSFRTDVALFASNPESTPVIVSQNRGYHESYGRFDLAGQHGRHSWKIGADLIYNPVHEALHYFITDLSQFDPGTLQNFFFV